MLSKRWSIPIFVVILMGGFVLVLYSIAPLRERLAWRVEEVSLRIGYWLNPPAKAVFIPTQAGLAAPQVTRLVLDVSPTLETTSSPIPLEPMPTPTSSQTPTPTQTPVPLPSEVFLDGVVYEDQHGGRRNYCAPANLAMALSFWGWTGNQDVVGPIIKPDRDDKNVMPYEMADYIEEHTDLGVILRTGGDLDTIRRFLTAGYPVLIEKGVYFLDLTGVVSWMGHYQVVTGFNDSEGVFVVQDSFVGPDHEVAYEDMIRGWRAFNYTYLILHPSEKEPEVLELLGPDRDETDNHQNTALKASNEIYGLSGIDQYFAWFNRGSSLVALQDYGGAAAAYDESFKVYPTITESERPWRMLWYQTGPYFAYYGVGRYYDLLYLADATLGAMQGDKNLEESYYWRGMAKSALGDREGAIQDFQTSLKYHPDFEPAIYQLELLGVQAP